MCGPRYGLGFLAEPGLPESLGKLFQKSVAVFDSGGGGLGQPVSLCLDVRLSCAIAWAWALLRFSPSRSRNLRSLNSSS